MNEDLNDDDLNVQIINHNEIELNHFATHELKEDDHNLENKEHNSDNSLKVNF
jgi:hypothetical protein